MALDCSLPNQEHILASLLSDEEFLRKNIGVIDPEVFSDEILRDITLVCWEFFRKHKETPVKDALLLSIKGSVAPGRKYGEYVEAIERIYEKFGINAKHYQEMVVAFIRHQHTDLALKESFSLLQVGDYDKIRQVITNAVKRGDNSLDSQTVNWRVTLKERLQGYLKEKGGYDPERILTGFPTLDQMTNGGLGRGEVGVIVAPAKHGKTTALLNFAAAAVLESKRVLYFTLELSSKMICHKLDLRIAGISLEQIKADLKGAYKRMEKTPDVFHCVELPTKALTVEALEGWVDRLGGCDMVLVDYGQLLKPSAHRGDRRHEISDIFEGLKRASKEMGVAIWTAHQANRPAYGSKVVDMNHVAEDVNVGAISDIALSLNQTDEERKRKRLRLYVMGSRIGPSHEFIECSVDWWTSTIKEIRQGEVLGE